MYSFQRDFAEMIATQNRCTQSARNLYTQLRGNRELAQMVTLPSGRPDNYCFRVTFRGENRFGRFEKLSISFPLDVYDNRNSQNPSCIETALVQNDELVYVNSINYSDICRFSSPNSLIREIRRLHNIYLSQNPTEDSDDESTNSSGRDATDAPTDRSSHDVSTDTDRGSRNAATDTNANTDTDAAADTDAATDRNRDATTDTNAPTDTNVSTNRSSLSTNTDIAELIRRINIASANLNRAQEEATRAQAESVRFRNELSAIIAESEQILARARNAL